MFVSVEKFKASTIGEVGSSSSMFGSIGFAGKISQSDITLNGDSVG